MFRISICDIIGYHLNISEYLLSQDIPSISIDLPSVSRAIHLFIQRYPIYLSRDIHLLSIYISRDFHLHIQRSPSTYPEISIYLSLDLLPFILLDFLIWFCWSGWPLRAAAVLHLRKQTLAGGSWRPGDSAAGQVGARRRSVTTPEPVAATTPGP